MNISVIGLGYIGLPTAALLASNGYSVIGMDVSEHAVSTINQGKIHIVARVAPLYCWQLASIEI